MHVTGCNNRLLELVTQFDDFFVDLDQVFIGLNTVILFICQHKCIVSERLDFQIIIEIYKSCNLRFRCISKNCLIQFSRLTGTSDQKPVPVFEKQTLRYTRTTTIIFQMRLAYKLIQVDSACLISCQNDCMISRQFLDRVDRYVSLPVQCIHIINITFFQHFHKAYKNFRGTCRIIHCPVVMIQRYPDCFGYCIQLETVQRRQKETCHTHRINICILLLQPLSLTVFDDKTHIKVRIVRYHNRTLTEFQKLRKYCLNIRCIHNHRIIDACQLLDSVRNRYFRVYKC